MSKKSARNARRKLRERQEDYEKNLKTHSGFRRAGSQNPRKQGLGKKKK